MPESIKQAITDRSELDIEAILELKGWVKNFATGESALNVQVYGVRNSFFSFDGNPDTLNISASGVIINRKLADKLDLGPGDDLIIRVGNHSELPADSPFAPEEDAYESFVVTVEAVLDGENEENFSLGINQELPLNLFINLGELSNLFNGETKVNRLIINESANTNKEQLESVLRLSFLPEHAGLHIRETSLGERIELISDRVFISDAELTEIMNLVPSARPVITYLANSIRTEKRATPYSFVSGLDNSLGDFVPEDGEIIISDWLAEDLKLEPGDQIDIDYFVAGSFKSFVEHTSSFTVSKIFEVESDLIDAELMPEFPGIAGSESCSNWDAGAPVDLDLIRDKDESYWYDYNGTPKAIINYNTAKSIWGNQFGPATAIRFEQDITREELISLLSGRIDPFKAGIALIDLKENAGNAANNSVDFTSLFLGLGFFIIVSALVLLILVISSLLETRHKEIKTLRSLGFENKSIRKILLPEFLIPSALAALAGALAGGFLDNIIISALNSVWKGAVQTDTLSSHNDLFSYLVGFFSTLVIIAITIFVQLNSKLKKDYVKEVKHQKGPVYERIRILFPLVGLPTILLISYIIQNFYMI